MQPEKKSITHYPAAGKVTDTRDNLSRVEYVEADANQIPAKASLVYKDVWRCSS